MITVRDKQLYIWLGSYGSHGQKDVADVSSSDSYEQRSITTALQCSHFIYQPHFVVSKKMPNNAVMSQYLIVLISSGLTKKTLVDDQHNEHKLL